MEGYYGLAIYTDNSDTFVITYFGESEVEECDIFIA